MLSVLTCQQVLCKPFTGDNQAFSHLSLKTKKRRSKMVLSLTVTLNDGSIQLKKCLLPSMKTNLFLYLMYFLTALGEQFFTCSPLAACIFRYNMLDQLTTQNFLLNTMLHNTEDLAEETPD